MSLTKAQLSALTDVTIFENTSELITATGVNVLIKDIIDSLALESQLTGGTGGNPGGSNTQIQYNDNGSFGASTGFTYDKTDADFVVGNNNLLTNSYGSSIIGGGYSGITTTMYGSNTSGHSINNAINSVIIGGGVLQGHGQIFNVGSKISDSASSSIINSANSGIFSGQVSSIISSLGGAITKGQTSVIIGSNGGNMTNSQNASFISSNSSCFDSNNNTSIIASNYSHIVNTNYGALIGTSYSYLNNSNGSAIVGGNNLYLKNCNDVVLVPSLKINQVQGTGNITVGLEFDTVTGMVVSGSSGSVGGYNGQIQFNDGGTLNGQPDNFFDINKHSGIFASNTPLLIDSYNSVIVGGFKNCNSTSTGTTIIGGQYNYAIQSYSSSVIGGVSNNIKVSTGSTIIGGNHNTMLYSNFSSIIGSQYGSNQNDTLSVILGGRNNQMAFTTFNSIIGGCQNNFSNAGAYSNIHGGAHNGMSQSYGSVINGGHFNCMSLSNYSVIDGGFTNQITTTTNAAIIGGSCNTIGFYADNSSIIASYCSNITTSTGSTIIGGSGLSLTSENDTVFVPNLQINGTIATNLSGIFVSGTTGVYTVGLNTFNVVNGIIISIT